MIFRILGYCTYSWYDCILWFSFDWAKQPLFLNFLKFFMRWPPTLCWTSPKTINGNRHFQVKAYGGKNKDRWVDIFPTKNKKDIKRISWAKLKSEWTTGWLRLPKDKD